MKRFEKKYVLFRMFHLIKKKEDIMNDTAEVVETEEVKPLRKGVVYGVIIFFVLWSFTGYLFWRFGKTEEKEQQQIETVKE